MFISRHDHVGMGCDAAFQNTVIRIVPKDRDLSARFYDRGDRADMPHRVGNPVIFPAELVLQFPRKFGQDRDRSEEFDRAVDRNAICTIGRAADRDER